MQKVRSYGWLLLSCLAASSPSLSAGCGSDTEANEGEGSFEIDDGAGEGIATTAIASPGKETTLSLKTGAKVVVPAGAVEKDVELGLKRASDKQARQLVSTVPDTDKVTSAPYVVTPHGTKFKKDVEVTLPINKAANSDKLAVIYLEDEKDTSWDLLGKAKSHDGGKTATIQVQHFSVLLLVETERTVGGMVGTDDGLDGGQPNTTRDSGTTVGDVDQDGDGGTPPDSGSNSGDGYDGGWISNNDAGTEPPLPVNDALYVIHNGSGNAGTVNRRNMADLSLATSGTFTTGLNRGASFLQGACERAPYAQVGDEGGIRLISEIYARTELGSQAFEPGLDREIGAESITAASDVVSMNNGLLAVADSGSQSILIFAETADASALPLFTMGLGDAGVPWALDYDAVSDRLFVALGTGKVAVFDGVAEGARTHRTAPSRTFSSNAPHTSHPSYRAILFDYRADILIVGDTGAIDESEAADFASDGSLVVFKSPGLLSGSVAPSQVVAGPATQLGNPADLHLAHYWGSGEGGYPAGSSLTVFVADSGSNRILQFLAFLASGSGNIQPTTMVSVEGPAALAGPRYVGDVWNCGWDRDERLAIAQGPGVEGGELLPGNYRIGFTDTWDLTSLGAFDTYEGVEPTEAGSADRLLRGLVVDERRHGIFSYSGSSGAGLTFVHALASRVSDELDTTHLDRSIAGDATLLNDPRGLSVGRDLVFVADPGAGDIKVFSLLAGGDVAPRFVIDDLDGAAAVEDVLFLPYENVLYAAASDGRVLAYDDVLTNHGAEGPTRTLSFGATHATALAGDSPLFVADMGEPGVADGAIYRLDDIETADGAVDPGWVANGANTLLEDPVDLAFDGDLWVADANANRVSKWRPLASEGFTGVQDVAPSATIVRPGPVGLASF